MLKSWLQCDSHSCRTYDSNNEVSVIFVSFPQITGIVQVNELQHTSQVALFGLVRDKEVSDHASTRLNKYFKKVFCKKISENQDDSQ